MVWKWIPHLREVEDIEEEIIIDDIAVKNNISDTASKKDELDLEHAVLETAKDLAEKEGAANGVKVDVKLIEYRDEADRPWWKFFNEYEYRINKYETAKHKWYYWFEEGTSKTEKILLIKLDILVAFYVFVVYWVKSLDSANIANAYVSGMKEEIDMKGNDYINAVTVYNVAAVVFQFPFMYLFPRTSLHYIIPALDFFWGIFTLATYRVNNTGQLQAMRFFVGAFESAFYPGAHYLMGSWYKSSELSRRGAIYYFGQMIGTISSGLFQASIHQHLNGRNGLSGWRWMFIIDAVITIPIGICGFFMIPGTPHKCYSLWLTDDEIRLARKRLREANINAPTAENPKFFDKKLWLKILKSWKIYLLTFFSCLCWNNSNTSGSGYILWLKSLGKYNTATVNNLSTISPSIGIGLIALTCGGADVFRSRYGAIALSQVLNFIGNLILAIWNVPESAKWFGFMVQYAGWAQASVMYSWINDILRHDPQERAITFLFLYAFSESTNVWIARLVWPTVDAPRFTTGYATTTGFAAALFFTSFIVLYFYKKEERKHALANGIYLYNSKNGDIPPQVLAATPGVQNTSESEDEVEQEKSKDSFNSFEDTNNKNQSIRITPVAL